MLDSQTKRKIDTARQILVGKVPDPKSQIEQITLALIYKFMNDTDKTSVELGGKPSYFIGDYERFSWDNLIDPRLSGQDRMNLYTEGLERMGRNSNLPELFRNIFKNAFLPFRDPNTLNMFLEEINGFQYDHSERLGDAYEYLLSIMSSQGDAGQFRTPRHIIDFIVSVVDPQKTDSILDPACGTAGFLISAIKHIQQANTKDYPGDLLEIEDKRRLADNVVGYDISPDMRRISLVNMFLHNINDPHIYEYDTLSSTDRWEDDFTCILANPPFMSPKGGIKPHNRFGIPSTRSEVLFVDYIMEHLTIDGKAGVIVPEGIIFQSQKAFKDLRQKMVADCFLWAVVSLPSGVFNPYSGVKTSILFFDRQITKKTDDILFVKVEADGFNLGAQRKPIEQNDLPEAYQALTFFKTNLKLPSEDRLVKSNGTRELAHTAKKQNIAQQGYNLSAGRYVISATKTGKWQMVELGEILEYEQPTKYIVNSTNYDDSYEIPVLTAGKAFILGYTIETDGIFEDNLPVIIFDDFTTATKFVDFPFKVKSSAMKILHPIKEKADIKFVYYTMQRIDFSPVQHKRYWISQYSKIKIPLPPLEVQKEIVEEIEGYQKIIDGAKQVVENWKPRINIDPNWELVPLSNLCHTVLSGGTPSTKKPEYWTGNIPWITSADIVDIKTAIPRRFITQKAIDESSTNLILKDNVIVVTRVGLGKLLYNDFDVCISQDSQGLILKKELINPLYLLYILAEKVKQFKKNSQGSTIQGVTKSQLTSIKIPLPPISLQQQIVSKIEAEQSYIDNFKKLIEIYQTKLKDSINKVWEE